MIVLMVDVTVWDMLMVVEVVDLDCVGGVSVPVVLAEMG